LAGETSIKKIISKIELEVTLYNGRQTVFKGKQGERNRL